jgi:rSAM/selenodomain-associated transferase 1
MARHARSRGRRGTNLPTLVIMAKTPRLGFAKRRLAAGIGQTAALRFYRACLTHTILRLGGTPRWRTIVAVTPDADVFAPVWRGISRGFGVGLMEQGDGDLGTRMQGIFTRLSPAPTMIVGGDIPALSQADIAGAFAKLRGANAVLGPATDGGYWLVGMRGHAKRMTPFTGVRWSTAHAFADTMANLDGRRVALAATHADVDNAESFRAQRERAERLVHHTVHGRFNPS